MSKDALIGQPLGNRLQFRIPLLHNRHFWRLNFHIIEKLAKNSSIVQVKSKEQLIDIFEGWTFISLYVKLAKRYSSNVLVKIKEQLINNFAVNFYIIVQNGQ